MKNLRVWIAAAILCGMILLTVYSLFAVRHSCAELTAQTARISQAVAQHAAPEQEIAALEQLWRKNSRVLHLFLPNAPLMELNETILRLHALCESDSDELTAELSAVTADLQWLSGM